jgi:hypothetical protein
MRLPKVGQGGTRFGITARVLALLILAGSAAAGHAYGANGLQPSAAATATQHSAGPRVPGVPCVRVVTELLSAEMQEVATGMVGGAATLELELQHRFSSDRPGWIQAMQVRDKLLSTASDDLLNRYARQVVAEITAYSGRIQQLCHGSDAEARLSGK